MSTIRNNIRISSYFLVIYGKCAIKTGDKSKTMKVCRIIINKFRIPALIIILSVVNSSENFHWYDLQREFKISNDPIWLIYVIWMY